MRRERDHPGADAPGPEQLSTLSWRTREVADTLDLIPHAVIVVGPGLRILDCNTAAARILNDGSVLRNAGGRLNAAPRGAQQRLDSVVGGSVVGDWSGVRSGGALACPRPPPQRPYMLHILPITGGAISVAEPPRAALVRIIDPDRDRLPAARILRQLYGFTAAESAVARLIVAGHGLAPIADQLSLSVTTVKTHLRAIFDKTDTHRQAELVQLLLAATP